MNAPLPPTAEQRPHTETRHGTEVTDEYAWLRDRDDPAVTAYLEAENAYTDAMTAHTKALEETLYKEIVGRVQETDESAPAKRGDWWYLVRTYEGRQYPVYCRRRGGPDGPEEVVLDQNALAEGHEFLALGVLEVSPDGNLLAYATDTNGSERFVLKIRDLRTGDELADVIEDVYYSSAWANDNATLFYTRTDAAHRPYQVWRHRLGTPPARDVCVYQDDDELFGVGVMKSKSRRFIIAGSGSRDTSECSVLPADSPDEPFRVIRPRQEGVEYSIEHVGDQFVLVTNDGGATNFEVAAAPVDHPDQWHTIIEHRDDVRVGDVETFATHLVLSERAGGVLRLSIHDLDGKLVRTVEAPEEASTTTIGTNYEFDAPAVRFNYTSLVAPASVYDEDLVTGQRELRKVEPVPGYDATRFESRRLWAAAADGVQVPISLVAPKGTPLDGSAPCLLYGYGSYEFSRDPAFVASRINLLERGFVYAIAHIRGGGEMGRAWYEDGKYLKKRNTFTDFIASAEYLIAQGWTSSDRLVIRGGSAGGLLMGACVNLRPDLFRAVVAEVPFVDVVNTMLDETLPLTAGEWKEWGDPRDPVYYEYMMSYSPYDNVEAKAYPRMLVTGGLNDPRVAYWEPAKWVARLRDRKTDDNVLLLKMEMGAGHSGPSGRYEAWRKEAFVQAFILDSVGLS
jgi:oligopeptidase B